MKKGIFITFEGVEGSGKTTIIENLTKTLIKKGYDVIATREPGGSDIAEQIREIILDCKNTKMFEETETLLYAASRIQHLKEKVIPAINEGKIIICDRYLDSSLAYQGYARNIGVDEVLKANSFALKYMPDITFFIDVSPEVGLNRIKTRRKKDRLDKEQIDFHKKVYEGYITLSKSYSDRIKRIDGNRDKEKVFEEVLNLVLNKIN